MRGRNGASLDVIRTMLKPLGAAATAGMFVVLVMGATVTNTGSEHGCGRSWPLCHGQLIPQMAVSTAIEFSHRAVVGVESILILGFAAAALWVYGRRRDMQILAGLMVLFLFLQAGLGAWAVMYPQLAAVLALHFGVSLVAFASVLLVTVAVWEADGAEILRDAPVPGGLVRFAWALTAYSYVVVYLGALVRHINADDACSGWPLCNGSVVPPLVGHVAAAFAHRLAALILLLGVALLLIWTSRLRESRPDLYRAAVIACVLVVLQALSGAVVAFTGMDLFSALLHAALVGLFFGSLTYLCMHVVPLPRRRPSVEGTPTLVPELQR
jgi:cytochrome c oxidase assembly protein subunit 15